MAYKPGQGMDFPAPEPQQETAEELEQKREQRELDSKFEKLSRTYETLLRAGGRTMADFGDEGFSGDAANLYTLVDIPTKQGDKTYLSKMGWGEFARKNFETDEHPEYSHLPFDTYVVRQYDSYFAEGDKARQMAEDPAQYLQQFAIFKAKNGQVTMFEGRGGKRTVPADTRAESMGYDEMLTTVRNLIIAYRTTPEKFAAFLQELPDDPKELGQFIRRLYHQDYLTREQRESGDPALLAADEKKGHLSLLMGMGINTVGIAANDQQAMANVLELKSRFDFATKSFK